MNHSAPNKNAGVTFIELMIVVVIIGILAGLAAPQYGAFIKRTSLLSESRRITSLLKFARSEARARGTNVVVSRSNNTDWGGTITVKEEDPAVGEDGQLKISEGRGNLVVDASFSGDFFTLNPRGWLHDQAAFSIGICAAAADNTHGRLIEVNRVGKITERPLENGESCAQ